MGRAAKPDRPPAGRERRRLPHPVANAAPEPGFAARAHLVRRPGERIRAHLRDRHQQCAAAVCRRRQARSGFGITERTGSDADRLVSVRRHRKPVGDVGGSHNRVGQLLQPSALHSGSPAGDAVAGIVDVRFRLPAGVGGPGGRVCSDLLANDVDGRLEQLRPNRRHLQRHRLASQPDGAADGRRERWANGPARRDRDDQHRPCRRNIGARRVSVRQRALAGVGRAGSRGCGRRGGVLRADGLHRRSVRLPLRAHLERRRGKRIWADPWLRCDLPWREEPAANCDCRPGPDSAAVEGSESGGSRR